MYRKNKSNKARPVIRNTAMLLVAEKILQLNLTLYTLPFTNGHNIRILGPYSKKGMKHRFLLSVSATPSTRSSLKTQNCLCYN